MEINDLAQHTGEWLSGAGPEADIVISSRVRLARNLADYPFMNKATAQDRENIKKTLRDRVLEVIPQANVLYVEVDSSSKKSTASSSSSGTSSAANWPKFRAPGRWPSTPPKNTA